MNITLNNWRLFHHVKLNWPLSSCLIIDENGSGKTSILSALFTIFTGLQWPDTKSAYHLRAGEEYLGISTDDEHWYFTGKIGPSGRFTTRFEKPTNQEIVFTGTNFAHYTSFPAIFTYIPTDNYVLHQGRTGKLRFLDDMLSQIFGQKYSKEVDTLDKAVKSKQKVIRYCQETGHSGDMHLINPLNQTIHTTSCTLWNYRHRFFESLQQELPTFAAVINSPLKNWQVVHEITDALGFRKNIANHSTLMTDEPHLSGLWNKELASGKVLYGAHRDDFNFVCQHYMLEHVLSRGELRLFVLFLKHSGKKFIDKPVWFFLDDVFNEFDTEREEVLFSQYLSTVDLFVATGTRKINEHIPVYSVVDLTKS